MTTTKDGRAPIGARAMLPVLTGTDAYDTHVLIKSDGTENTSPKAGQPYDTIGWDAIVAMAEDPPSVDKDRAPWIIPSAYCGPDGRGHAAQRESGSFWIMPLDVDEAGRSLEDVEAALRGALGGDFEALIYSTRSSTEAVPKWRALVPLAEPVEGRIWSAYMRVFCDRVEAEGVKLDRVLCRTGQVAYLPNAGAHYDGMILEGARFAPAVWLAEAEAAVAEEEARLEAARQAARDNPPRDGGVISQWCALHPLDEVLQSCGYAFEGGRSSNWRSPLQQSASYATRVFYEPGREYWISLSQTDFEAGVGQATKDDHCFGDAFDIWVHFEHGRDFDEAMRAASIEVAARRMERFAERVARLPAGAEMIAEAEERHEEAQAVEEEADQMLVLHLKSITTQTEHWFDLATPSTLSERVADLFPTQGLTGRYGRQTLTRLRAEGRVTAEWPISDPRHPYGFVQTGWHGPQPLGVINKYRHRVVNAEASTDPGHPALAKWREVMGRVFPVAAERIWAEQWMAHKARKPWDRLPALVNATPLNGTGRGLLGSLLIRLFGQENVAKLSTADFTPDGSRFNEYLGYVLAIMDEVRLGDMTDRSNQRLNGKAVYNVLKDCVDPGEKITTINRKYGSRTPNANSFTSFLLFTNNEDALPIDGEDKRRWAIMRGPMEIPPTSFGVMVAALREDEAAMDVIWRWLCEGVSMEGFNPYHAPETAARKAMVDAQVTDFDFELDAMMEGAGWPLFMTVDILRMAANLTLAGQEKKKDGGLEGALKNWMSNHTMALPQPEGSDQRGTRVVFVNGKATRVRVLRASLTRRGTDLAGITAMPMTEVAEAVRGLTKTMFEGGKFKPRAVEE